MGGGGGGGVDSAHYNFEIMFFFNITQTPWNLSTFSEIYLQKISCGLLMFIDFGVTMATNF